MIGFGLQELSRQFDDLASGIGATADSSMPAKALPHSEIEFITIRKSLATAYSDIQYRARRSIEAFDRGSDTPDAAGTETARRDALERGVNYRVVYDPSAFKRESGVPMRPGSPALPGSSARVSSIVPARLVIRDGEESLIFSAADRSGGVLGARIHSPWFAALLNDTFETVWGSALPLPTERVATSPRLSGEEQEILRLLATGLTDESIARFLGVSLRTVQRKVQAIQRSFGATSRFQLGAMSAA
ncbi:helix-turn-helix transcriptional regulator [Paeniglutamicibacter kerguelensis]|uniref:DNA-binding CsgD family transcriptional regulator n=1 Tax=Paeniglutamicibacter kerguelensis TaxID=254788 RepID=A0ABS4XGK9_9MICC|nr:helix-turn-helix transcriptional regulator [Paeniglutamicibacter kerguelensis]MBP2387590.1 DNA-binding CsgD family transcriptional regulator [Paeniglutamicibacter kerguelensis]